MWRPGTVAFGLLCVLAGFLIGLLLFGSPWHLPPAWGDIPTWLTAIGTILVAGVACGLRCGRKGSPTSGSRRNEPIAFPVSSQPAIRTACARPEHEEEPP
jgi:hypothetical protein